MPVLPRQTWTPPYLLLISVAATYKRLRYYVGQSELLIRQSGDEIGYQISLRCIGGQISRGPSFLRRPKSPGIDCRSGAAEVPLARY